MVGSNPEITQLIPHRPPFLWVDKIITADSRSIETEKHIPTDLDIFAGHYPDHPIMPGVLLCEAVFQSGALLISRATSTSLQEQSVGIPVLTRIREAKFKRVVRPGDTIRMKVTVDEIIGDVWFMKGRVLLDEKMAVKVEFGCMLQRND